MALLWLFVSLAIGLTAAPVGDPVRVDPGIAVPDVHGVMQHPFAAAAGHAAVVFFVTTDCPGASSYAPEIRRICETYKGRASCTLDYVDPTLSKEAVSKHLVQYGHGDYPAVIDTRHLLVKAAGATVTPEVLVVMPGGQIGYRGRIDDKYFAPGRTRFQPTTRDLISALESVLTGRPVAVSRAPAIGCSITPFEFYNNLKK